jgi:tetratricopeptide (TPR) repeat protein
MKISKKLFKISAAAFFFLLVFHSASAFSLFEEGERLFLENKPREAAEMLEAAAAEDPTKEKIYLYLGIIYEGMGDHQKAVEVLEEGISYGDRFLAEMYLNRGNNLFVLEAYEKAEESFTMAIKTKSGYAEAYLNRGNTRVKLEDYSGAVSDYELYLKMKPAAKQREKIEKMIDILKNRIAEKERIKREEEKRRLEEEQKRQEEERRRAEEERKRKEEEERRREEERKRQEALLKEVLDSLEKADEDTTVLSPESEEIEEFDLELELEE